MAEDLHIEENVRKINKMWFEEILDYCDKAVCEPNDLIKAHQTMSCEKHKKDVAGISDMKLLAEMIGDLHYETLADLINHLADKIYNDGYKDHIGDRKKLGAELYHASMKLKEVHPFIQSAYYISKPFMK